MSSTTSPNMNLIIPGVGSESGPTYAFDINSSLTLIDQHDHTPGKGVQISAAGININTDLTMNGNSLIDLLTAVFTASTTASITPMSLSVAPGGESPQQQDLWYTPDTGIPIQITKNGQVNVVASSIDGETYAAGTFYWTQAQDSLPTTPANFDIGSITIRPNTALTTFGVELNPSSSISSQYSIQLPLLPVSQKIMTLDASGNMTAPYTVDGSTITIASNVIGVPAGGITDTQIAMNTITGDRMVNGTVGYTQLATGFNAVWNEQTITSSGSFVVPAHVNTLVIQMSGGGGGGGGGGGSGSTTPGSGGSGGSGSTPQTFVVPVTAGITLTATIGAAGTAGTAGSSAGAGTAGGNGGDGGATTLTGTGVDLYVPGGQGGDGGGAGGGSPGVARTAYAETIYGIVSAGASGAGQSATATPAGNAGKTIFVSTAAVGGAASAGGANRGRPGGGGGSGFLKGGDGGNGQTSGVSVPNPGSAPAATAYGAGGGGGGSRNAAGPGDVGGVGMTGVIKIRWLGTP